MENIEDAITEISRQLRAAGLRVVDPFGPFKDAELVIYNIFQTDAKTGRPAAGDRTLIGYSKNQWWFQSWERTPGPGSETVEHWVPTVEEVIAVALRFYLGKSENIEGWLVPIHRHPGWEALRVRQLIARAQSLSQAEWDQVSRQFDEHYLQLVNEFGRSRRINRPGPWSWARWFACMAVLCEHEDPSSATLWIRRDLEEAFLVKEACPCCHSATLVRTSVPTHTNNYPHDHSTYKCIVCNQYSRRSGDRLVAQS